MQSGPFAALDFVLPCQLFSCLHFRLLVLPLIFHIFCISAFCCPPLGVHSAGFFSSVSQLWNPGSPSWHAVNIPQSSPYCIHLSPAPFLCPPPPQLGFFRRAVYYRIMPKHQGVKIRRAERYHFNLDFQPEDSRKKYWITNWTEMQQYYYWGLILFWTLMHSLSCLFDVDLQEELWAWSSFMDNRNSAQISCGYSFFFFFSFFKLS